MHIVNIRFQPKANYVDTFRKTVTRFTDATKTEEGCLYFEWFRSTDFPGEYLVIGVFTDEGVVAHQKSEHFLRAQESLPPILEQTPLIVRSEFPKEKGWERMHDFTVY